MAIPGIPQNMIVQSANQEILVSWDLSAGATSYLVERSEDNVTFTLIATVTGSPLATSYLDTAVTLGTQYWYRVAATQVNAVSAIATLTFNGQPNNGDTVSVANVVFTAVTSGATGNQFNIESTVALTIASLITVINTALSTVVTPSVSGIVLTLTAYTPGLEGNGLELTNALTNVVSTPFSQGADGQPSSYTISDSAVPVPVGEFCLSQIRLKAMQRADRVNSNFVTKSEWDSYINQSMFELYDILVTEFEDYYVAPPIQFTVNGNQYLYPLPDGSIIFQDANNPSVNVVAPAFYKLLGVDLALNNATNAYVTINKFNFIDRNRFVYPNTASTIYGVFNMQYRVMGRNIEFIPTPTSGQHIRLWYIPRLTELLRDTDITTVGISGWAEYIIVKAAYYALTKEESDTSSLVMQLQELNARIVQSASNRDAGQPDTVSDTRSGKSNGYGNGFGSGWNGSSGGFSWALVIISTLMLGGLHGF